MCTNTVPGTLADLMSFPVSAVSGIYPGTSHFRDALVQLLEE